MSLLHLACPWGRDCKAVARAAAPYALLAGILALYFWPVWLLGYTFPTGGGDLWGQLEPVWAYVGRFVRHGVFPLWSTQMMAGDPIIAEPQYGLLNPLNWPLFLAGTPRWAILARGLLPLLLAGAGLYTFLRRSPVWRLRTGASLIGATAFMLSDPFITHLGHPQINDAMAWLPWSLLAVDAILTRRRIGLWTTGAVALVLLAGHYQTALFTGIAVALYALWRLAALPPRTWPKHVGRLGVTAGCAVALAMPAVLASLERYPYTERALLTLLPWRGYQWPAAMAVDLFAPWFHGRGTDGFWASWARVEGGYAGAVALALAVFGLLYGLRRHRTWYVVLVGAFGTLFALGYDGPVYPLLARIDLIARFGKTARAISLLAFAIACAAALGAEALGDRAAKGRRKTFGVSRSSRRLLDEETPKVSDETGRGGPEGPGTRADRWALAAKVLGSVLLVAGAAALWVRGPAWVSRIPAERQATAWQSLALAAGLALAVVVAAWALGRARVRGSVLLLLLAGEFVVTGTWVELEPTLPSPTQAAVDYIKGDTAWYRVDVDGAARGLLSPAVLLSYGFDVPQGSGNPMELFSYTQWYYAIPFKGAPAYQVLGAKYIIVPKGALPGGDGIWPVFTDAPLVDVHLNTNALPRVWLVYDTVPVQTIEAANALVFADDFQPVTTAVTQGGPDLDGQGSGTLEVTAYGGNRFEVIARTDAQALVVLSDLDYPGWTATVDGAPAPILKTDGIFRGVVVPPGEHRVAMRYRPRAFRLGLGIAAAAALVLVVAAGWRGSRRGRGVWYNGERDAD